LFRFYNIQTYSFRKPYTGFHFYFIAYKFLTYSIIKLPKNMMMKIRNLVLGISFLFNPIFINMSLSQSNKIILQNPQYTLYSDSVVQQNKYVAKAISSTEIVSNYKSPANEFLSSDISFKFSINGKDNEMKPGVDHHFDCAASVNETPPIVFGEQMKLTNSNVQTYLKPETKLTIRLDMRKVLAAFNSQGFFTDCNGNKIFKEDFKGVYIAGGTAPMIWDFDNLVNHGELQLKDADNDGIYETTLLLNAQKDEKQTNAQWKQTKDLSAFPQYQSAYPISDAIYNMSLEEMVKAVEPDSTFRTGKEWAGVWTRDISYSIILSMAYLQPKVAMNSLMKKVNKKKKIIQDTGTGGAYPASTDRMIWATAAWEVYKATGNKDWLQQAFIIIKNSIEDDIQNAYNKNTRLVKGESSFLDWREQTYPRWMQPVDIYVSENLGTNAVHYQGNIVLAEMAKLLNNPTVYTKHTAIAAGIKAAINKQLWMKDKGYYAQFLYGRNNLMQSQKSEALGEALCVLFNIADEKQQASIISKTPFMDFGVPCIYPQIPGIPPYHNNAVWPFVQTYFALAAAKAGNEKAVLESFGAIYRPAALFATNKENFVAQNGDFAGTQINSSNMLWSLSGNIALVHKILFGIQFDANQLSFKPFVPKALDGKRTLTNFVYRNAILDITVEGYGNSISSFLLDGKPTSTSIPATLKGKHFIQIILANNNISDDGINKQPGYITLATPILSQEEKSFSWLPIDGAVHYTIYRNGLPIAKSTNNSFPIADTFNTAEYQVAAIDKNKISSFASEPIYFIARNTNSVYPGADVAPAANYPYKGFTFIQKGFIELSTTKNKIVSFPITVNENGRYAIECKYANGNGPTNTLNKCAIRTLKNDGKKIGTIVFPQRGNGEWSNWGFTNSVEVFLEKGKHTISLTYEPWNENMNGEVNQAMLDFLMVTKQ
jgi:hypothetical protein